MKLFEIEKDKSKFRDSPLLEIEPTELDKPQVFEYNTYKKLTYQDIETMLEDAMTNRKIFMDNYWERPMSDKMHKAFDDAIKEEIIRLKLTIENK